MDDTAQVTGAVAERAEVIAVGDLRDLLCLMRLVDLDAQLAQLGPERVFARSYLGGHVLEGARQHTERVRPRRHGVERTRLEAVGLEGLRSADDASHLLEVLELAIAVPLGGQRRRE